MIYCPSRSCIHYWIRLLFWGVGIGIVGLVNVLYDGGCDPDFIN